MQQHAPLLSDTCNERVDGALKDAKDGFVVCHVCGFESVQRLKSCSLCGHALHFKKSKTIGKVDVEGNLFWYRDSVPSVDVAFAYVVRIQPASPTPVTNDDELMDDGNKWKHAVTVTEVDFPSRYSHFVRVTTLLIRAHSERILKPIIDRKHSLRSDAGGLLREWFILFADPATGLFVMVNESERSYSLNPHAASVVGDEYKHQYYAVGRILGRALLEGVTWGFHLSLPLLKKMLGMPVSFDDLQFHDPSLYKNLWWLLDNDGAEYLALTFKRGWAVTDDNKREFVDLRVRYELFESIQVQLQMFLMGFYEVIPQHLLMSFDPEEFDLVLSGTDSIDVDDWEKHSKYSADLHEHPVLKWFWAAVRALPVASQRRLLHFATGSSRVPVAGFAALTSYDGRLSPFTLVGVDVYECPYIKSHSCFNRL
ncbi:TPA: hypothetical protein N0F65_000896 [Lagenidium giganteum]|uniref:HECT-type E3 ubiquitin transferase n=1 Tax=Lagenidium giganteum TaxID=4803 RepID=A0AAV2Z2B9_9STRA|nr:TPA: hypothetical protein N0F65_000896 [Lagenidium giganteum]